MEIIPENLNKNNNSDFRDYAFKPIMEIMRINKRAFILTNDMGAQGLDNIKKKFPTRVINAGICEQNIASVAGGLAKTGNYVFIYGIISHIIFRSLEQIKIDICVPNLPVTIIGVGAGLSYGQDGPTHHGVEDIGISRVLPNLNLYNPSDFVSTYQSVYSAYYSKKPSYIRLDKERLPSIYKPSKNFSEFNFFGKNKKLMLVGSGISTWICLKVQELLKKKKIYCSILDLKKLTYLNEKKLSRNLLDVKRLVIIEENLDSSSIKDIFFDIKNKFNHKFKINLINIDKNYMFGSSSRKYIWKKKELMPDDISRKLVKKIDNEKIF